jgi:hypothetical protein
MQSAQNPISTVHNEESRVMNILAKFQLNRTTNARCSEQLIKTGQKIPETRFSFSLSGGSSSFFSSLFSDFSLPLCSSKG